MTAHRFHPDPARGDDARAIVYDRCPRCDQLTADPSEMDPVNLWTLWRKMERAAAPESTTAPPVAVTANKSAVILDLRRFALIFEALTGIRPTSNYLQTLGNGQDRARGADRDDPGVSE